MRRSISLLLLLAFFAAPLSARAGLRPEKPPKVVFVPREDLDALLAKHRRGVLLSVEEYLDLFTAARGRVRPEARPPVGAVVLDGEVKGTVNEKTAHLTATFTVRVLGKGLTRVPFPVKGAGVGSARADDREALLFPFRKGSSLLLFGEGDHRVELKLVAKVSRREDVRSFYLTLPPATALSVDLSLAPGLAPLTGTLGGTWRAEKTDSGTHVTGHLSPGGELAFSFTPRREEGAAAQPWLGVDGRTLHSITRRLVRTVSLLTVTVRRKGVKQLDFVVPAHVLVTGVAAPGLEGFRMDDKRHLVLTLSRRTEGSIPVVIRADRSLDGTGKVSLPEIHLLGAAIEHGVTGLRFEGTVTGRATAVRGYARVAVPRVARRRRPGPAAVLAGATSAFRYWSADRALTVLTKAPKGTVDADVSVVQRLLDSGRRIQAVFVYHPKDEPVFDVSPELPPLYVLSDVKVAAPVPSRWDRTKDGRLAVTFPGGSPPGREIRVTFSARLDSAAWRESAWRETSFPLPVLDPGVSGWIEGRLAVFADEEFATRDESLANLSPEPVARLGLPHARLGYRWTGTGASGRLVVDRRAPKVTVRHVAVMSPGEKVARYTGFLDYTVKRAGVRRFRFDVSGGFGDRLTVTAPGGAEPIRTRKANGIDEWEFRLPERVRGDVLVALSLDEVMPESGNGRKFVFPVVRALGVEDESAWLAVTTGENIEVSVSRESDLREISPDEMVYPGKFKPARALFGAWQATAMPFDLEVKSVRHEDAAVLPAFVSGARILSVVAADGTVRTRADYRIRNIGRQSLTVRLPAGSVLWGAHVAGRPVKPARESEPDTYLVPLVRTGPQAGVDVTLTFETSGVPLSSSGTLRLSAPELVGVLGAEALWRVWLPGSYRVSGTEGVFAGRPRSRPSPWIARFFDHLVRRYGPVRVATEKSAASGSLPSSAQEHLNKGARSIVPPRIQETKPVSRGNSTRFLAGGAGGGAGSYKAGRGGGRQAGTPAASEKSPNAGGAGAGAGGTAQFPGGAGGGGAGGSVTFRATDSIRLGKGATIAVPPVPHRLGRPGTLPLEVRLPEGGTLTRLHALGIRGSVAIAYARDSSRTALGFFLTILTVVTGLILTGQLRRGGPGKGRRVTPLVFIVGLGAFATFAPSWFSVRDPIVFDGIARGAALTLAVLAVVWLLRLLVLIGRPAATAGTALLLVALLAAPAFAGGKARHPKRAAPAGDTDTIYVPYDPAHPGEISSASKVFVPFERFQELWNAAHPDQRIDKAEEAPVPWLVTGAGYRGEVDGETVRLIAEFDLIVLRDGTVQVPLSLSPAVVESATMDDKAVPVLARKGVDVLVVSGKGAHRVVLTLRAGLMRSGDDRILQMNLPAIPKSRLTFTLPSADLGAHLIGPAPLDRAGTKLTALLGGGGRLRLSFGPKSEAPKRRSRVEATTREALALLEGRVELRLRSQLRVVTGSLSTAAFALPKGFDLLSVTGPDVKDSTVRGTRLDVTFGRDVKDETSVELTLVNPDGVRTRTIDLPDSGPLDVLREHGVLAVATSPDLRATTGTTKNLERIANDPRDFAGVLPAKSVLRSAWRFVSRPIGISTSTEPIRAEVRAQVSLSHLVTREWLRSSATFRFAVRGDGRFEFPVHLPAGVDVESVTGQGLSRWWRDGDRLVFATSDPVRGTFAVRVDFRKRLDPSAVQVALPEVHAVNVDQEEGSILVAHEPGISLTVAKETGLVSENVAALSGFRKLDPAQVNVYAWTEDGSRYDLAVARSFPAPRVHPVTTTRIQVTDDRVVVDFDFEFTVENAGEDTFRVFFPAGEAKDPIVLAEGAKRTSFAPAERKGVKGKELTVVVEQPVLGTYGFRVVSERRLETHGEAAGGSVTVASPRPEGQSPSSYVLIENQSSGEVVLGGATGLERADPARFPWLPKGLDPRLVLAGFKAGEAEWTLPVTLEIHDFAKDYPEALIPTAEFLVAVGRDGFSRNRATWRVLNRKVQFLGIEMPPDSTLEAVRVKGHPVKPGQETVSGRTRILVPLARMRPGDVSTTVTVFWSRAIAGHRGAVDLADLGSLHFLVPEIPGFDIQKTFFTVELPDGYDYSFTGNMQRSSRAHVALWQGEKAVEDLERLADVQTRGSFGQKMRATTNFFARRKDAEEQLRKAVDDLKRAVPGDKKQLEARYSSLIRRLSQADKRQFATRSAGRAATLDLGKARELAKEQRQQQYRFKGKSNVAGQQWSRNAASPAPQAKTTPRSPAEQAGSEAGRWRKTLEGLEKSAAPQARYRGPTGEVASGFRNMGGRFTKAGGAGSLQVNLDDLLNGLKARTKAPPSGVRGLISLDVTVPKEGRIFRFERRDGSADLTVEISKRGAGGGFLGFLLLVLTVVVLVDFYRYRPHERIRGFKPICLIVVAILLGIAFPLGVFLLLPIAGVIAGGIWLYRDVSAARAAAAAPEES